MSKNILISGVSRGLGLATARIALGAGWNVYGVSRSIGGFRVLVENNPTSAHFAAVDLTDVDGLKHSVFERFIPADQHIHGVVNNAAEAYDELATNLDQARVQALFRLNVFTPMEMTKYAIRRMLVHSTPGAFVNISSISAHRGYKGLAMYAASKGAIEAFSKSIANEWGERGIRSNCVVAGFMETDMSASLTEDQRRKIYNRSALRQATKIESVAATVVHLLSDAAASITGQNVIVDSGTL